MKTEKANLQEFPPAESFLTVSDVKNYLRISQSAAYGLTHCKDFPVSRFGTSIRIPREAFLAWVASKTVIPPGVAEYMPVTMNGGT